MKKYLITILLFGWMGVVWGQGTFNLSFVKDSIVISKSKDSDIIIAIPYTYKTTKGDTLANKYILTFSVNESTLPNSDYSIDFRPRLLSSLQENETVYVRLKKDILTDRERRLDLKINIKNDDKDVNDHNLGDKKNFTLIVKSSVDVSDDYTLLSYLGTNFDMADGKTKAKNLFFATNVFVPPIESKNRFGFYLSLYGNRTMSNTDSSRYSNRAFKVQPVNDSLYYRVRGSGSIVTTTTADNMGVHFSPLIKINKRGNHHFNLYYAPSLEFVWRRINTLRTYGAPTELDTVYESGFIPNRVDLSQNIQTQKNEFDFSVGLVGAFLTYETKAVSVRIHSSVGYLGRFHKNSRRSVVNEVLGSETIAPMDKAHDIFYTGRAWITEAVTGITLQAEITNQFFKPRPFFGVTLSKAFKLKDIGSILSPLVNK
ncbi:hypothetical protein HCX49_19695 [Sphingobacterium kitahiroshimense]|uniref:hypothetical protein n=1 Tax=Sphingobacterium sp. B16(2022) TaxID=2914044 RepID=UPI00143C280C|nr:hypothetical protein [Sphingobacterium sp. B16(2022)]NJI75434.1 hypothetical protein [Sphingobacterium sp. B16(2022)]